MILKRLILLLFSLLSSALTIVVAFSFIEKTPSLFDKLFYKKSSLHGYDENSWVLSKFSNNFLLERRIRDLREVIGRYNFRSNFGKGKVLGSRTGDNYIIALIGDSITYGLGVRENQSFGRVLESRLNEIRPTKVLVLALPGDSVIENYAKFLMVKKTVGANLYITEVLDNDLVYDHADKYPNEQEVYRSLIESCPGTVELNPPFTGIWEQDLEYALLPSYSKNFSNRCFAETVFKKMLETGDKILFYAIDNIYQWEELSHADKMTNEVNLELQNLVKNAGGTIVVYNDQDYQEISAKEDHPSPTAHRGFAEFLYQEITTNPRWGFMVGQSD